VRDLPRKDVRPVGDLDEDRLHLRLRIARPGHLPIVDGRGRLVGVVSERVVSRALDVIRAAEGRCPSLRLGDIMLTAVLKVSPHIAGDGEVSMDVEAEYRSLSGVSYDTVPAIAERTAALPVLGT